MTVEQAREALRVGPEDDPVTLRVAYDRRLRELATGNDLQELRRVREAYEVLSEARRKPAEPIPAPTPRDILGGPNYEAAADLALQFAGQDNFDLIAPYVRDWAQRRAAFEVAPTISVKNYALLVVRAAALGQESHCQDFCRALELVLQVSIPAPDDAQLVASARAIGRLDVPDAVRRQLAQATWPGTRLYGGSTSVVAHYAGGKPEAALAAHRLLGEIGAASLIKMFGSSLYPSWVTRLGVAVQPDPEIDSAKTVIVALGGLIAAVALSAVVLTLTENGVLLFAIPIASVGLAQTLRERQLRAGGRRYVTLNGHILVAIGLALAILALPFVVFG